MKKLCLLYFISAMCCTLLFSSCSKPTDTFVGKWKFVVDEEFSGDWEFLRDGTLIDGSNKIIGSYTIIDEHRVKINMLGTRTPTDSVTFVATVSNGIISTNLDSKRLKWERVY